jgi:AraC-like DNA-binding protein
MRLPSIAAGLHARAWPPVLATRGPGLPGALHSHHSLHFVLALQGLLRVRASASDRWTEAPGVLTAPNVPHAVDAAGVEVVLVFLDPESEAGTAFAAALVEDPVRLLSAVERGALVRDVVPRTILRSGAEDWVRAAARTLRVRAPAERRAVHPRVRRLLAILRGSGVGDIASLETLAALVHLSPGRLMHVFTESIGIPLRPYLAWLRLQRAAMAIVNGQPMGDAAHAAGFADSAHMSRTFKRMLGVAPSLLRPMRCSPHLPG